MTAFKNNKRPSLALWLTFFILCGGLSNAEIPTKNSEFLWLGTFAGEIQALEEKIHISPNRAEILLLKEDGEKVGPYDSWALVNRDRLEMMEKNYSLAQRGFKLNMEKITKGIEEEKEQLDNRLDEIHEEVIRLKKLLKVASASEFKEEIQVALEKVEQEKEKLQEKFEEKYSPEKLAFDKDQLEQKMEAQRRELENFREDSYLKAGVAGRISYLIHKNSYAPDSRHVAKIEAAEPIALIRNDEVVLIIIPESNFDATLQPEKNYFARVTSESGMRYVAEYYDDHTVIQDGKPVSYYRFKVSDGDTKVAKKTIGEACVLNLLQRFQTPHLIIEKEDLIKDDPTLIKENGWKITALKLFPEMQLAGEGKGAIALAPKNAQ